MDRFFRRWLLFGVVCAGVFGGASALAEPWLSTRYAQNCAGCHAPGRKNLQPMDRRCTLSCQGCHVNPNGGGLRSGYGKWNEDRWLRTFRSDVLKNAASFAPTDKQHYGRGGVPKTGEKVAKAKDKDSDDQEEDAKDGKKKKKKRKKKKKPGAKGFPLVEIDNTSPPEHLYLRDGLEFHMSADRDEFMYQVPQEDPLRKLDDQKTDAGGDIRWQVAQLSRNGEKAQWKSFLMSADFGLRARPLYRNLHFVYEARFQGSPVPETTYESMLLTSKTRGLYAMIDDLPFNVFIMGGYYRPLFGNFVPDHYTLAQEMTSYAMSGQSKNYSLLYNAVSVGTAPNVPYLNVHAIQKQMGDKDDKTAGFAANAGLRFVSFGASLNYSYWRTDDKRPGDEPKTGVEMHSIGAAGKLFRTVIGIDAVSVSRDRDTEDFRQGGVTTLDTYTQLWRENYFTLNFSKANTTPEIKPGAATQMKAGVKSFVIPGVEVNLAYENTEVTVKDVDTKESVKNKVKGMTGQLHVYF